MTQSDRTPVSTPAAPATEAGRALLDWDNTAEGSSEVADGKFGRNWQLCDAILAIEREATQQAAGLTADPMGCDDPEHPDGAYCRNTTGLITCYPPSARLPAAAARPEIDDMRVMVRALYASGLTDDMNPSERRQAAVRLRDALREWSARLASLDEDSP